MTYCTKMRFVWIACVLAACGPDEASGPCKESFLPGDLVITEVFADYAAPTGGTGTDEGKEWFEIYNNADRPVSLKGLTIVHSRPDGSKSASHTMADVTIAPGQYFTLGNSTSDLLPPYVDYGYSAELGDFYNTDGGKLALKCGETEIDSAIYDTVKSGHSRELSNLVPPDYTRNDDTVNWCEAHDTEFETNNFGTPGQDNDCAPVVAGACTEAGTSRAVVSPGIGELVITEVMPSPSGTDSDQEWLEVKALADVDLNGLGIDRAGDTANPQIINSPTCIHVAAGSYAVIAHSADSAINGGITNVAATFSSSLALVAGTTTTPGDIQIVANAVAIDSITWVGAANGKALQLDPDLTDASSNDEPSNFCDATVTYGAGDFGSPGLENSQCALLPPPGMCDGGGSLRAIQKPAANNLVITEFMPNPKVEPGQEWFEITNIGSTPFDLNGLGLDRQNDARAPDVVNSAACKQLLPGQFALFARSSDSATNGMLPTPDATFGFSMVNSGGSACPSCGDVQVVDPATCSGTPLVCTTVYDSIVYTTTNGWPSTATPDGASAQLKPPSYTVTNNDSFANFCLGTTGYGDNTNLGTPKAANVCP